MSALSACAVSSSMLFPRMSPFFSVDPALFAKAARGCDKLCSVRVIDGGDEVAAERKETRVPSPACLL